MKEESAAEDFERSKMFYAPDFTLDKKKDLLPDN
jgi:hypothetical protein